MNGSRCAGTDPPDEPVDPSTPTTEFGELGVEFRPSFPMLQPVEGAPLDHDVIPARQARPGDGGLTPGRVKNIRYSAVLILITAGAWAWWQGRAAFDDAYISFRYAMNLVSGDGLTFNPGFAVEGYSNLAWVPVSYTHLTLPTTPYV